MVMENNESSNEEEESSPVEELKEDYKWKPILQFFLFMFHWQVVFNISTAVVTSVLKFFKFFLSTLAQLLPETQGCVASAITALLPSSTSDNWLVAFKPSIVDYNSAESFKNFDISF